MTSYISFDLGKISSGGIEIEEKGVIDPKVARMA
jgi:hypothetical protein